MRLSNITERRPRFFYGWYIVGASVALNFYLSIAFFQGLQIFFLPILTDFGWSRTVTSGAFSLRQLESGLLAPVVGFLVDRWGPRAIILMGVVVAGAGMVMLGAIQSLWMFYAALMIASVGTSAASHGVTWPVVISSWFHRLRGRALGMAMLGPVVAGPVVIFVAVMEQTLGWRMSLFVLGVGLWIVGIPLALVARPNPERYGYHPDGDQIDGNELDRKASSALDDQSYTDSVSSLEALRTRQFWLLSLLLGSQFLGTSGLMVHFIALLQSKSYSATEAAGILGLIFLLSGIGRMGAGMLADIVDQRLALSALSVSQAVALALLVTLGPGEYWKIGIFALLYGAGFGGTIPIRPYLTMKLFGLRNFGAIQGLSQGVAVICGIAGPVFYGWVFDNTNSYNLAIYVSVVVFLVSIPLALMLGKSHFVRPGRAIESTIASRL